MAIASFLLSFASTDFRFISLVCLVISFFLFCFQQADDMEYDHECHYPVFSFSEKGEAFYNFGWIGLLFLTVFLVHKFLL